MPDNSTVHKLILKPYDAHTACGLTVVAFYPMSGYASSGEVGVEQFMVTTEDKKVKCEKCKEGIK